MRASVVISTKNRKYELQKAVASVLNQSTEPEVIVIDDGSTDGTSAFVRERYPNVRLERSDHSLGLIAQRNHGALLATGDIIFSIDDDAVFESPQTIGQTLDQFNHSRIGAVAIPFKEPRVSEFVFQKAPDATEIFVTDTFRGTAYAVRKDVFQEIGCYRSGFIHQGEEPDFCLRMLDSGYVVRLGTADPICHYESIYRDLNRMDYYGARNAILFTFFNVPGPYLIPHLLATTCNVLTWTFEPKRFLNRLLAVGAGYRSCLTHDTQRVPVSRQTYRLFRQLRKAKATPLSSIERKLTPINLRPAGR